MTDDATTGFNESLIDTAVDLLVYSLKYQTFLADQDAAFGDRLYQGDEVTPPYSDGPSGFEFLLTRLNMTAVESNVGQGTMAGATQGVLSAFAGLEACFRDRLAPTSQRAAEAIALTRAAVTLVDSLTIEAPERYRDFLERYRTGDG